MIPSTWLDTAAHHGPYAAPGQLRPCGCDHDAVRAGWNRKSWPTSASPGAAVTTSAIRVALSRIVLELGAQITPKPAGAASFPAV